MSLAGQQEGHLSCKNPASSIPKGSPLEAFGGPENASGARAADQAYFCDTCSLLRGLPLLLKHFRSISKKQASYTNTKSCKVVMLLLLRNVNVFCLTGPLVWSYFRVGLISGLLMLAPFSLLN